MNDLAYGEHQNDLSTGRTWPAPWAFGVLILPLGMFVGFIWTALPFLLSKSGVSVEQISRMAAILQIPANVDVPLDTRRRRQAAPPHLAVACSIERRRSRFHRMPAHRRFQFQPTGCSSLPLAALCSLWSMPVAAD